MKSLPRTLFSVLLLLPLASASAQQAVKPVLSASPTTPPVAATPASAGTSSASNALAVDPTYIIGPEDGLKIEVFKEPDFSTSLPVRPDGMITMPSIGDIKAAGLTTDQLSVVIKDALKKYIVEPPPVTVTVTGVNSKHIYMVGEIGHVGLIPMTPGMNILQAIATAGGLGPYAKLKQIYIQRTESGQMKMIHFDYKKALKNGDMQGITLKPDDTIVVP